MKLNNNLTKSCLAKKMYLAKIKIKIANFNIKDLF
jgi:hypothetical protein